MSTTATSLNSSSQWDRKSPPFIAEWLRVFQSRQSWLSFLQGIAMGGLALIAGASLLMLMDAGGLLSDTVRWCVSILIYASACALAIVFGIASPWLPARRARVANDVELLCPEVREQLLACVELDAVKSPGRNFSEAFLGALEDRVAHALRERSIQELLPWSQVRFPLLAVAISIAAIIALCFLPSLSMPLRLQRALLPFVEIERPSRTRIEVIKPQRAETVVPENQAVELEILLSGLDADSAVLEWRTHIPSEKGSGRSLLQTQGMIRVGESPSRFACTLPIATQLVEYRFRSGDGQTPWRVLRPTPRPRVATYKHRIQFPEYVGLPAVEWRGDQGSIQSLAGSRVELGLEATIPLISAHAIVERLDTGDRETVPLTYSSERSVWSFAWNCESDVRFQFQLKGRIEGSEDTIESTYSPSHELNVVVDHSPTAGWLTTSRTLWDTTPRPEQAWIVAPEELIPLAAWVADDLPGATMEQQISINRGPWKRVPVELREIDVGNLPIDKRNQVPADGITWSPLDGVEHPTRSLREWVWDAMTAEAALGDTVSVRVAVKDSFDQWSYSPTIEFSLATKGFERSRHDTLFARASLLPELVRLSQIIRENREALQPMLQEARSGNPSSEVKDRVAAELQERSKAWSRCCEEIRTRAVAIVSVLPRPLDQSETEFVSRLVSRLEREHAARLIEASVALATPSSGDPKVIHRVQEAIDSASQALQQADDHASRLVDIYRQFIGHETLTAITKDMMVFKEHEEEQIRRIEKMDFARLARSQQIAIQYVDLIQDLARRMEPSVSQHLQNQFQEFCRNLDQTRTDLTQRIEQEPTPENYNVLANDVRRVHENLRHQHWGFHLDGGLWWNISDIRRDLIQRSSGVHTVMTQAIQSMDRGHSDLSDKQLPSNVAQQLRSFAAQMAGMRTQNAAKLMVDARDFHQHRNPADSHFSRDMGLASRAWEAQFELWANEPHDSTSWREVRETIQKIVRAYRVLEVAHEMQDLRFTLEHLRRQEQYEWRSIDGQLTHVRLWDGMHLRIELVQQWMNESGFPQSVGEAYRALLWNEHANRIRQKMDPRRHANNETLVSAATDIEAWMREWREAESKASPTIEEARQFLASLSPTIPELAQRAAKETKELQDKSRSENLAATLPSEMDQQNQRAQRSIDRLEDALMENALRQDILDPSQLEKAKDSDLALQWLNELRPPMNQATEALIQAQQQAQNISQVQEAAEQAQTKQSAMAKALEQIEQHFSILEESHSRSSDSPDSNRLQESRSQMQAESKNDRQPLKSYDQADRISEMANSAPEALLKQLESELKRNEPMQRELSQLSQDSVADAVQQLKKAATEEEAISQQLENSDVERRGVKEIDAQMLRHLGDRTDRVAVSLLEKSAEVVKRLNLPETRKSLNQMAEDLRSAARDARNASPDQPASDLRRRLSNLNNQVSEAERTLSELTPRLESKIETPSTKDDKQRQGQLTEMKSWQSLMRDDSLRRVREQAQEAKQSAEQSQREAESRDRELQQRLQGRQKLMDEFKAHPDRSWVQEALDQNTLDTSRAAAELANAQRLAESAKRLAESSSSRAQSLENAQRGNLDRPNPTAALAEEQLVAATKELQSISEQARSTVPSNEGLTNPNPSAPALSDASKLQDRIAQQVEQLADQIARSSRHEERLANAQGSKSLAEQSQAIAQVRNSQLASAQEQLRSAAESAQQKQDQQASQSRDASSPQASKNTPNGNPSANQAMQSTDAAAQALESLAKSIEQVGAPKSDSPDLGASQTRSRENPSPESQGTPKDMARLLDAIDQKLFGGGAGQRPSENGQSSSQPNPSQDRGESGDAQGADSDANRDGESATSQSEASQSATSQSTSGKPTSGESSSRNNPNGSNAKQSRSSEGESGKSMREAFRDAANEIAAQLQNERMAKRQNANPSKRGSKSASSSRTGGQPDDSGRTINPAVGDSRLPAVPNLPGQDWGMLREQRAEDVTQGRRDALDPEYSEAIRAYFRALGQKPN